VTDADKDTVFDPGTLGEQHVVLPFSHGKSTFVCVYVDFYHSHLNITFYTYVYTVKKSPQNPMCTKVGQSQTSRESENHDSYISTLHHHCPDRIIHKFCYGYFPVYEVRSSFLIFTFK
jgi:hypothetical protein